MNKTELVEAIAKESGLTGRDSEAALNAMIAVIQKSLKKKQDVRVTGFGTFTVTRSKARIGLRKSGLASTRKATSILPRADCPR